MTDLLPDLLPMTVVLAELDPDTRGDHPGNVLVALERQRALRIEQRQRIVDGAKDEHRDDLLASEHRDFERLTGDLDQIGKFITRAVAKAEQLGRADKWRGGVSVRSEATTYGPGSENSYFRDLLHSKRDGDPVAQDRLRRHATEVRVSAEQRVRSGQMEYRDISRVDTAGGHFVPPLHLVDQWIGLARASRPTANIVNRRPLPGGTDSIVIPKITTGTATAIQTADNAAVQETDVVDAAVTSPVRTIAGQQDVAVQLLEQSPIPMDEVIFSDLVADLNTKLNVQVLSGSGLSGQVTGIRTVSGISAVTYTDASPTVAELYPKLADAIQRVATLRFLPATHIVLHPRRWAWILASLDTTGRPLVVPNGGAFNAVATTAADVAEGVVGELMGLKVVADPSIPTNLGTNEDVIIVLRADDVWLFESTIRMRVLPEVGSGTLTTRLQAYSYLALATRYAESISTIAGTGLILPTW